MISGLSKSLVDASTKILQDGMKKDALFQALLEEYGVVSPAELGPIYQEDFVALASIILGESYPGIQKTRKNLDLFATNQTWLDTAKKRVMAENYQDPKINAAKKEHLTESLKKKVNESKSSWGVYASYSAEHFPSKDTEITKTVGNPHYSELFRGVRRHSWNKLNIHQAHVLLNKLDTIKHVKSYIDIDEGQDGYVSEASNETPDIQRLSEEPGVKQGKAMAAPNPIKTIETEIKARQQKALSKIEARRNARSVTEEEQVELTKEKTLTEKGKIVKAAVKGGKTMTGQKKDIVDTEPKQFDGIKSDNDNAGVGTVKSATL